MINHNTDTALATNEIKPESTVHFRKQYEVVHQSLKVNHDGSRTTVSRWNGRWEVDWWEGDVQYGAAGDTKEDALKNALENKRQGLVIYSEHDVNVIEVTFKGEDRLLE